MNFLASTYTSTSDLALGINIDHVATLRNQRQSDYPSPVKAALLAEHAGADLITLHLREDRRHIRDADLFEIKAQLTTRMNLECAVTPEMIDIALEVKPQDVCLVPERREELTTEGGLLVLGREKLLADVISLLNQHQIRPCIFIDPNRAQIQAAFDIGVKVIELHTGAYAQAQNVADLSSCLQKIIDAAQFAKALGMSVHAGHGLTLQNTPAIAAIVEITELNIGHAIVAESIFVGWQQAIADMKACMVKSRHQSIA